MRGRRRRRTKGLQVYRELSVGAFNEFSKRRKVPKHCATEDNFYGNASNPCVEKLKE